MLSPVHIEISPKIDLLIFFLGIICLGVAIYWLYFENLFILKNINGECMDFPVTAGYLEMARSRDLSPQDFFNDPKIFGNYKEQAKEWVFNYPRQRFQFEWVSFQSPLITCYVPFVKLWGVNAKAATCYATTFSLLAWIGTAMLALKMFGRWHALLSVSLLITSLSWLIHIKAAVPQPPLSICLMIGLAYSLFIYAERPRLLPLFWIGAFVAFSYLTGWIVFGFALGLSVLALPMFGPRRISLLLRDYGLVVLSFIMVSAVFTFAYATYYRCSFFEIHQAVFDALFSRFSSGSVPGYQPSLAGKLAWGFRGLFMDMHVFDHPDKYLEGSPAIPFIFSLFFFLGLIFALRGRKLANKMLFLWMAVVFGILGSIYLFANRYALLALPAMSIMAANGVIQLYKIIQNRLPRLRLLYAGAFIMGLGLSVYATHEQYYNDFTNEKPPNFEVDRLRGHAEFSEWLTTHHSSSDTLVVLGDGINLIAFHFLYNTFDHPYPFVIWTNYFGPQTTPQAILEWEKKNWSTGYKKIVYVFATQLLTNPLTKVQDNNWQPFLNAHPGIKPQFYYSYADRPPLMYAFEVSQRESEDALKKPVSSPKAPAKN